MKNPLQSWKGDGLRARAWRAIGASSVGFAGESVMRLASNIILTRLLFPEAFGLMLIVSVVTTGVTMFSDLGIKASIIRSPRGDEETYLNTAWTLQILRGLLLAVIIAGLAWPAAALYDEADLAGLLLIVALNPLIAGVVTTRFATEERHLRQTSLTIIGLCCTAGGLLVTIALSWWMMSVWALAIGSLANPLFRVFAFQAFLPGIQNRLCFERAAVKEIFGFGKFVFLSTFCSFLINQGDKALFGGFVSLSLLGIYNIAWGLGSLTQLLMRLFTRRVVYPLYRMRPPDHSLENQRQIFRARRMLVAAMLLLNACLALLSVWIVDLLYTDVYALAAPMMALICLSSVPILVLEGYANALMAYGDSRAMFLLNLATAIVQTGLVILGLLTIGLVGGILAPGLGAICTYPLLARFVGRYKALDYKADFGFMVAGLGVHIAIVALHAGPFMDLLSTD